MPPHGKDRGSSTSRAFHDGMGTGYAVSILGRLHAGYLWRAAPDSPSSALDDGESDIHLLFAKLPGNQPVNKARTTHRQVHRPLGMEEQAESAGGRRRSEILPSGQLFPMMDIALS